MTKTGTVCHRLDRTELLATVFARVTRFHCSLIWFVFAFMESIRMTKTGTVRQRLDGAELLAAVFTIELCHIIKN